MFKLFDRRFLLQLSIRFGSIRFFANFLPAIVEAILPTAESMHDLTKESILW